MVAFRHTFIIFMGLLLFSGLQGCASRTAAPHDPQIAGSAPTVKSRNETGSAFFRHRWWNYYQRGIAHAEDRRLTEAMADLSAALDQRDGDQRMARTYGMHFMDYFPHRELGIIYFELGQYLNARKALERSLSSYPSAKARFYRDQVRRALIRESGRAVPPPDLELDPASRERWTRADRVLIKGMARDANYVHQIKINGHPIYFEGSQNERSFQSQLKLPEGRHQIVVQAVNLMGRAAEKTVTINVDRRGPMVMVEQITQAPSAQGQVYEIRGMIADAAGVARVRLNDTPLAPESKTRVPFYYRLPVDRTQISIEAVDRLGNKTAAKIPVGAGRSSGARPLLLALADGSRSRALLASMFGARAGRPPEIELKDWSDRQTVYLESIYIDGLVRDPDDVAELTVNGTPILSQPARLVYFNHIVELAEGENTIHIMARDDKGNLSEKRIRVTRNIPAALKLDARLKVTVIPFEKQGHLTTAGYLFQTHLLDAMFRQNRFRLVERNALDSILKEQRLSQSALMDRKTAVRVGRLAAAQSIIAGDIVETRQGIEIVSRMIDTESSDILALKDVYSDAKDMTSMRMLARGMAIKLHREFPLVSGLVVSRKGRHIMTDLGEPDVKLQRRILVYKESEIRHPVSGKVLGLDKEILCRARVTMVDDRMSKAKLLDAPSEEVNVMHKVITE